MSHFEYVVVLMSVVSALALGHLLMGVASLAKNRRDVTGFPTYWAWLGLLFLSILLFWWAAWDLRDARWTFLSFAYVMFGPIFQLFAVTVLIPDRIGERAIDLKGHYFGVRRLFMAAMLGHIVTVWFDGPLLVGQSAFGILGALHVGWAVLLVWGLSTESPRAHGLIASAFAALIGVLMVVRLFPGAF